MPENSEFIVIELRYFMVNFSFLEVAGFHPKSVTKIYSDDL